MATSSSHERYPVHRRARESCPQNGRSPRPERRCSASDRPYFVKHSRSEPALSTHDECPVSGQVQPGNVESDQALALQCAANFGLDQLPRRVVQIRSEHGAQIPCATAPARPQRGKSPVCERPSFRFRSVNGKRPMRDNISGIWPECSAAPRPPGSRWGESERRVEDIAG